MLLTLLLAFFQSAVQDAPLPNLDAFLKLTKAELIHQLDDDVLLNGYVYRRKTIEEALW